MLTLRKTWWIGCMLALSACFHGRQPDTVYMEAGYVPPNVTSYPSVVYEGRPYYHAHDHWYAHDGRGWVRRAPPVVSSHRYYVAPRAHTPHNYYPSRREYQRHVAPPAHERHDDRRHGRGR